MADTIVVVGDETAALVYALQAKGYMTYAQAAQLAIVAIQESIQPLLDDLAKVVEVQEALDMINTVNEKLAEIQAVAADIANVNSVAGALTAVNAVYSALSDISAILTNIVAINTTAANIENINLAPQAAIDAVAAQQEIETLIGDPEEMDLEYFTHSDTATGFPVTENRVLNLQLGADVYQINVKKV